MAAIVIAAAILCSAGPHTAFAASQASIEAREENGFGRIVIDFDRLPPYRHELDAGVLVMSFDDPVDANLDEIPRDLPDYVGLARRDPDGRAFRLALNRAYLVNVMEAGDQLYVDILPPDWKGLPPPLPTHIIKALSRLASEAERRAREAARQREAAKFPYKLNVHMARHPTFSRIVFDWNRFVTVDLGRRGSEVTVEFNAQADANLAELKSDPPKFLRSVKLNKKRIGMEIVLTVDEDVDVRGFREGLAYVVDLTGPDVAAIASAGRAAEIIGAAGPEQDNSVPQDAKVETSLPAGTAAGNSPKDEGKVAVTTRTSELSLDDAMLFEEPPAPAPEVGSGKAPEPDPPAEPEKTKVTSPPVKVSEPEGAKPADPDPKDEKKAASPEPGAVSDGAVPVLVEDTGGNLRLTFPFAKPLAAAAFRRGRTIWLIFDTDTELDVEAIKEAQGGKLIGLQHVRSASMQYLRLQLSRAWLTYVASKEASWIVDIGDMVSGQSETVQLQRKLRSDKRSLIGIRLEKPGRVHWLTDPEIGDRLAVVTAYPPQRSVAKPQDFVEFKALATAHGIAIRPNSDDIAVRLQVDEVVITRRRGLTLSAGNVRQYVAGRKPLANEARLGFLDVNAWRVKDPDRYGKRVHALQRAIALSAEGEKNAQRFALARLYFANGYFMEAHGILRQMARADPEVINDPSFNALRGGTLVMMGRTAEAREDFEVHALANDQDAALWVGLLDVADHSWESALESFEEGADAIYAYSPDLQARFRLAAARSALQLERLSRAANELEALPSDIEEPALAMNARLLRGWYLESIGRTDEAIEAYDTVLKSHQRPAVAEAELRTIGLLLKEEKISRADAIKNLERLQLVWRGDDTEIGAMRLLADLYVQEKRYRDAFTTMKNGVLAYPKSRQALLMQDEMKQVFRDLYLRGSEDGLTPIESLALYYDFRQLTPVGRQGDEMIRRLADRLIEFDLLDQAAGLLDHQVNKRLKGAARSQVATRLAMVHLMNQKPEQALKVIRQTRQAGLPKQLRRSRNLLEARALGELGRAEAAVEILNTMEGEDVEGLKADALWIAQKWPDAGDQLERMLGARWQETARLSEAERFNVLRAAISYSLAGDQFALDRVRKKFYEKMVKTPDAESFVMVTKPVKSQGVSFRDLARDIAATDTLDSFMKQFRARYDVTPESSKTSANRELAGKG